jgi:mRNA interferase MazF
VSHPQQGEVWWAQAEDKRRPVLVVTRSDAIPVLTRPVVAPITRTVRGIRLRFRSVRTTVCPSSARRLSTNVQPINRRLLTQRIASLDPARRHELCDALAALADC